MKTPDSTPAGRRAKERDLKEEMHAVAALHGGRCLSASFGPRTLLEWECAEGHNWRAYPSAVASSGKTWCPDCLRAQQRNRLQEMKRLAAGHGGRCLSVCYLDSTTRLVWECSRGHSWEALPAQVRAGNWCPMCAQAHRPTIETMRAVARQHGGECLSDSYINGASRLRWRCANGHEWTASPVSVQGGIWCARCNATSSRPRSAQKPVLAGVQRRREVRRSRREEAETGWVSRKITGCDFPDARRLALGTWRYLAAALSDYLKEHGAIPDAVVVPAAFVAELLDALEIPPAESSSFNGIGIVIDEAAHRPQWLNTGNERIEL